MIPMLIPLIGAASGALLNRDDPLKGALMGGLLGAAAPAAGGLLGAGGATAGIAPGATAATSQAGLLAAQEAGLGAGALGWGGATTGLQGGLNSALGAQAGATAGGLLDAAGNMAGPVGSAVNVAQQMLDNEPQIQAPPPPQLRNQPMNVSGAIQQGQQMRDYEAQDSLRRRALMNQYAAQMGRIGNGLA